MVSVLNLGGGDLNAVITEDANWLDTSLSGTELYVSVNKSGVPAGHYTATIVISGTPGDMTQDSPQTVMVDLWLLQGSPPGGLVYLPLINR